jgi:hypothetical protein
MNFKKNLILSTFFAGLLIFTSCSNDCIKGEGPIDIFEISVADFTGINLNLSSNVTIVQGTSHKVEVTGHANIVDLISSRVSNGIWEIDFQDHVSCINTSQLSFEITVPTIEQIHLNGSGDIVVNDFTDQIQLDIDINGSGNIALNDFGGITQLNLIINGSGAISGNSTISTLEILDIRIDGSGNYSGFPITTNDCTVNITGSGDCKVTVLNTLNAFISGSGDIYYKGNPSINSNIDGSGRLIDAN